MPARQTRSICSPASWRCPARWPSRSSSGSAYVPTTYAKRWPMSSTSRRIGWYLRSAGDAGDCSPRRADDIRHEPGRTLEKVLPVEALELRPRRQRPRIEHAVNEQRAVEVVHLVLEGPRSQAPPDLLLLASLAVEVAHADTEMTRYLAAQVWHRQATLVDVRDLVVERLDHRVDHHGERDRGLVRVARVSPRHLHHRDPQGLGHLVRGEPGSVRGALRLDQVVDQALHL